MSKTPGNFGGWKIHHAYASGIMFKISIITSTHHSMYTPELQVDSRIVAKSNNMVSQMSFMHPCCQTSSIMVKFGMEAQGDIRRGATTSNNFFSPVGAFHCSLSATPAKSFIVTMFSKFAALLFFATCAIAGQLPEGTYRIVNVASQSSARVYNVGNPVFVSSTTENPGPFEIVSSESRFIFLSRMLQLSSIHSGISKMLKMTVTPLTMSG